MSSFPYCLSRLTGFLSLNQPKLHTSTLSDTQPLDVFAIEERYRETSDGQFEKLAEGFLPSDLTADFPAFASATSMNSIDSLHSILC